MDHLRWDLRQIFEMAVVEDYIAKNPATLIFTPPEAKRPANPVMTWEQVVLLLFFSPLGTRELVICRLATVEGMRLGEIFGLQWRHVKADHIEVAQRLYRGRINGPRNDPSKRTFALSYTTRALISKWESLSGHPGQEAWVFPSETLKTPLSKDNCWRRWIAPNLNGIGLGWLNFQVTRRTHSSLMGAMEVSPKIVADQLGHSVDVDLNVYTKTPLEVRQEAVEAFERKLEQEAAAKSSSSVMYWSTNGVRFIRTFPSY